MDADLDLQNLSTCFLRIFEDITILGLGYISYIDTTSLMRTTSEPHTKVPL